MPPVSGRGMPLVASAGASQTRRPEPTTQRLGQRVADCRPLEADIRADESDRDDGNDRNQRGDQDVLDEPLPLIV
jgi:hypothetical protein